MLDLVNRNMNLFSNLLLVGVLGYGYYAYKQTKDIVRNAVDQPSKDFWEWYYGSQRAQWVKSFSWEMMQRHLFGQDWKMSEEAFITYSLHYSDVLGEILTDDRVLKEKYRNEVN